MEGVVTLTYVHVKGKILLLYVNAEKAGIEWSQSVSKAWSDLIITQNPSDAIISRQEEKHRSRLDFVNPLIPGVIGLLLIALPRLFTKAQGENYAKAKSRLRIMGFALMGVAVLYFLISMLPR